jgi:hypothetical protein
MSMSWDYVSELRLLTGLLFIPKVIYGEPRNILNDVDRGKFLTRPSELHGNPTSTAIW